MRVSATDEQGTLPRIRGAVTDSWKVSDEVSN